MLLTLLLACGTSAPPAPDPVALTPPWSTMGLPIGDAAVVSSRPTTLHLRAPAASTDLQLTTWQAALQAQGWVVDVTQASPAHPAVQLTQSEGATLQLALHTTPDHTAITLALTPPVVP